jgi:tRNA nucleotidyltransferase (CCA-adding enzyme)
MSAGGEIRDYFGGESDLRAKIVRCVGVPEKRFREDGLRIMRALRFASALGFAIEDETERAINANKNLLHNISSERLRTELTGLLCGENAGAVLRRYTPVIGEIIPEILPMVGFDQHTRYHCHDVWEHTLAVVGHAPRTEVMRWTALLHDVGKPRRFTMDEGGSGHFYGHAAISGEMADDILKRLKFDNDTRHKIRTLVLAHMDTISPNKRTIRRLLRRYGKELVRLLIAFKYADNLGQAAEVQSRQQILKECEKLTEEIIRDGECFRLSDLAVDGRDLIAMGISGREIGNMLDRLLSAVVDGALQNDREALLAFLRESVSHPAEL